MSHEHRVSFFLYAHAAPKASFHCPFDSCGLEMGVALHAFNFANKIRAAIGNDDGAVMSELLKSLTPTPSGWSSNTSYCNWTGVKCDDSNRVKTIHLPSSSFFTGKLPSNLSSLSQLTTLAIQSNALTGPIPSFSNLTLLQTILLDFNNFTSVPDGCFSGLTSLRTLSLSGNYNLKPWTFPTELSHSSNLFHLDLGNTSLFGPLPEIFDMFTNLQDLGLYNNDLSGVLPKTFAGSSIQNMWLPYQKEGFSGSIDVLSQMTNLKRVYLQNSQLTGTIPDLSNCNALFDLQLSYNQLTGVVPSSLMGLSSLKNVSLDNNMLQGPFPVFGEGVKVTLDGTNSFCLTIPSEGCDPRVSALLEVAKGFGYPLRLANSWKGNDPCKNNWSFIVCTADGKIVAIRLAKLGLKGTISPAFANLTYLRNLYLNGNNLTGTIPDSLTTLAQLEVLDVSNNNLSGEVPKFSSEVRFNGEGNVFQIPYVSISNKVNRWWIWLIIGVGVALSTPAILYLSCTMWRKYKAKVKRRMLKKNLLHEIGGSGMLSMVYGKARKRRNKEKTSNEVEIFSFETIVTATNNFSTANKLGEGGFGPVYKGILSDQLEVAIKRLSKSSGQGLIEFKNEANVVAKLQHTNLVKLLGFCIERDERILVYEYMLNKSLDFYLFDSTIKNLLDWKKRLNIIGGIAQGLLYLHKYSRLKVIHRDLKAGNILLDEEMNPKISDFGMARIFGLRGSEENTNRVVGTYGYMSPEYAMNGVVSIKTDVFSFGVLLLEILSGKKNNSRYHPDRPLNLIGYAWQLWNDDATLNLIDPSLNESCNRNEVVRCIHIGLLCVQDQANDRPTMLEVVSFLSNETIKLHQPKQPAFFINVEESELPNSRQEYYTLNDVTISSMHGR
ncbi:hypothetical protein RIF29_28148 [Crotalaria pallida]|uniref:non-specific serine/threonine protein kinase n=1 Tax=Crotalaria pallida TaxID=3830 RepID=A0AAN9EQF2_CROPI